MSESRQNELLELYKLHARFADNVSQRRESVSRLHVSLLSGLGLFAGIFTQTSEIKSLNHPMFFAIGIFGIVICFSWRILIKSYQQLNSGKFKALDELENEIAFPFFRREWHFLEEGRKSESYWKLTEVETILPSVFGTLFLLLTLMPIYAFIVWILS